MPGVFLPATCADGKKNRGDVLACGADGAGANRVERVDRADDRHIRAAVPLDGGNDFVGMVQDAGDAIFAKIIPSALEHNAPHQIGQIGIREGTNLPAKLL